MIVMKFGGTSVKTASAMRSAAACVLAYRSRHPVVVLSACGGITNRLLDACRSAGNARADEVDVIVADISAHHCNLVEELFEGNTTAIRTDVLRLIDELREYLHGMVLLCECTDQSMDTVASFGERLSSLIFSALLAQSQIHNVCVDARSLLVTDSTFTSAVVDLKLSSENLLDSLLPVLRNHECVVTQGFIASDSQQRTTTLGRGGSDVSAAIIGALLHAEEIQIWTDVDGVLTSDPRIVNDTRTLSTVTFSELRDLSFFGAKVLHPDTIKPAIDAKVPVTIRNTFHADAPGTTAIDDDATLPSHVRAVSLRSDCISVRSHVAVQSSGKIVYTMLAEIAREAGCDVLLGAHVDSSVLIVVPKSYRHVFENHGVCEDVAVVCVCGPNLRATNHAEVLCSLCSRYDVSFIALGTSNSSHCAVVPVDKASALVRDIHHTLVTSPPSP